MPPFAELSELDARKRVRAATGYAVAWVVGRVDSAPGLDTRPRSDHPRCCLRRAGRPRSPAAEPPGPPAVVAGAHTWAYAGQWMDLKDRTVLVVEDNRTV